jgi:hypothetical protein
VDGAGPPLEFPNPNAEYRKKLEAKKPNDKFACARVFDSGFGIWS